MKIAVLPDCQVRPGDDTKFLSRIGNFIAEKKPDVIVNLGDFADMPSLSSYDQGKKAFEGRRYKNDVEAAQEAMIDLMSPIARERARLADGKRKRWNPRLVLTLGNHENRINRAVNDDAKLEGVLSVNDLKYRNFGWEVHDFLDVVVIGGVAFSHYFVTGLAGRPASTAQAQLNKKHMSCVAGHQQGLQVATAHRADGKRIKSIIAGSCYEHNEDYLGPQGNNHWRGLIVMHEVQDGEFDHNEVSLNYINKFYG